MKYVISCVYFQIYCFKFTYEPLTNHSMVSRYYNMALVDELRVDMKDVNMNALVEQSYNAKLITVIILLNELSTMLI